MRNIWPVLKLVLLGVILVKLIVNDENETTETKRRKFDQRGIYGRDSYAQERGHCGARQPHSNPEICVTVFNKFV